MAKPRYLTDVEVSQITGRAVQTLRNDRHKGQGLPYRKFGRQVRYLESEVFEAMEARRIEVVPV
jgi:predicted DNA-binding transcriptional regulator AlpA